MATTPRTARLLWLGLKPLRSERPAVELYGRKNAVKSLSVAPSPKKMTVLVVEDDRAVRELYRSALMGAGYAVVAVEDGIDALRAIERGVPHAVVLDLGLPRLGGHDVQRELLSHAETSRVPIVVVTGSDISDLNLADFACVLQKPINPEELVLMVDKCLRQSRWR
jgi:DNA-binding response OmpR family regulator